MAKIKHPEQRAELQALLASAHLRYADVASRAGLTEGTVKKYAEGWQPGGKHALGVIRQVCQLEIERLDRAASKATGDLQLRDELVEYAGKLLNLPPEKRAPVLNLIDQLGGETPLSPESAKAVKEEMHGMKRAIRTRKHSPRPGPAGGETPRAPESNYNAGGSSHR